MNDLKNTYACLLWNLIQEAINNVLHQDEGVKQERGIREI